MSGKKWIVLGIVLAALALLAVATVQAGPPAQQPEPQGELAPQAPLGTGFTYQGQLRKGDELVDDTCDFRFSLYDDVVSGSQVGSVQEETGVSVTNGLFTVHLDFGGSAFGGEGRWLRIEVQCPGDADYADLGRQALTAAPYALYALGAPWSGLSGVPAGFADGVDDVGEGDGAWSLTGNAGTDPSTNFLGTTDGVSLTLAVSGTAALRLAPNASSPNLIGGYSGNRVTAGAYGATIGGGGASGNTNRVTDDYGTVGGGRNNQAGDNAETTANAPYATVGGGYDNTASGRRATVGGGGSNEASGYIATVGGGGSNEASDDYATVGGGAANIASGGAATIGGGYFNTASGSRAIVGGGQDNTASGWYATVGGGRDNTASGDYATVSGGSVITAGGDYAAVGGGSVITASGDYAVIGGGQDNTASGDYATVGGGRDNTASGGDYGHATVGGGGWNRASGGGATVGGGNYNTASGGSATVGGGYYNTASGDCAVIPGGCINIASGTGSFAAGLQAEATHEGAFVWSGGGRASTYSWGADTFTARAHGGARFYSASGTGTGVQLSSGAAAWGLGSDRDTKENFAAVDRQRLLDTLAAMPVQTWNLKSQSLAMRHIGPVAQDFNGLFGYLFGEVESAVHINNMDAIGVSLAAVQGLYERSQEQAVRIEGLEAENAALQAENAAQQAQIDDLAARLAALERGLEAAEGATSAEPLQSGFLPGAGGLLAGLGLVWLARRGSGLSPSQGGILKPPEGGGR